MAKVRKVSFTLSEARDKHVAYFKLLKFVNIALKIYYNFMDIDLKNSCVTYPVHLALDLIILKMIGQTLYTPSEKDSVLPTVKVSKQCWF